MQPWTEEIPELYTRKTKTWIYNAWGWGTWMKPRLVMDISFIQILTLDVEKLRIVCQREIKLKNKDLANVQKLHSKKKQICSIEVHSKGIWSKPRSVWRRFGSNSVVALFYFVHLKLMFWGSLQSIAHKIQNDKKIKS